MTATVGGGGNTTTAAAEGSCAKRPGGDALPLSWRQLHDDGDSDGHGDGHSNGDGDGDGGNGNKDGDGDLPPLQFHHPPSPGAPLNCIQRVRSRSREDIEWGGLGIQGNQYINSLPAMGAHERPLFNELLRGLVALLIVVRC